MNKDNLKKLYETLSQKDKTINALMKRVESLTARQETDYNVFNRLLTLEDSLSLTLKENKVVMRELESRANSIENERSYYLNLLNSLNDFVGINDLDGNIVFVNSPPLRLIKKTVDEVIGKPVWEQDWFKFESAEVDRVKQSIFDAIHKAESTRFETQIRIDKDGERKLLWVLYSAQPIIDKDGVVESVLIEGFSVHERKHIEHELQIEKERFQTTLESIGDAVIATDTDCKVTYMNPVAEQLTGWRESRALGKALDKVFKILNEETGQEAVNPSKRCMEEGRILGLANHTALVHKDGHTISIEDSAAPIRAENGEITGSVLVFHDVSGTRAMAKELEYHANHDALTGLVNRRNFEERIKHCIAALKNEKHQDYALLYLDLDQFKLVNDTCGHAAGDELLRMLVEMIKPRVRDRDTFARLGGDEFGLLLEHCPANKAIEIANDIRRMIEEFRYSKDELIFNLGASIGVVNLMDIWDIEGVDPLKLADTACYEAKDRGRNRVHVYQVHDEQLQQRVGEMGWVSRITNALENDDFELYCQPIKPISSDKKQCVEVLVRMKDHTTGELIPPGAFLPAAERYELMDKIDRWVIKNTLGFFETRMQLLKEIDFCSINLSARSLGEEDVLRFVQLAFVETGLPYEKFAFEVTETSAIQNFEAATHFMSQMRTLGCEFFIDDFGSGMSSFAYLKRLDVQKLKIDGLFVRDIADDPVDYAMVKSINDVGHAVGMKTVAEFVESDEILKKLEAIGVDYAQGYGISKPFPLADLTAQLVGSEQKRA